MTNLVIDIGNTLTKIAVFNNRKILETKVYEEFGVVDLQRYLKEKRIDNAIVSSVDKAFRDIDSELQAYGKTYRFTTDMSTNITNHYKTPQTLGVDRLA